MNCAVLTCVAVFLSKKKKKKGTNMLFAQVTATLRNLVDSPLARSKFLSISALPQLCTVMGQYMGDKDVCTNIARIFR